MFKFTEEELVANLEYLKRDIQDDWFCDPQNYEDVIKHPKEIINQINKRIVDGRGVYSPKNGLLLNVPKGNGGFRYSIEMDIIDRLAYHLFGIFLISKLDKILPFNIMSHRFSGESKSLFKETTKQWQKFENYTKICGVNKCIIETDLSNYYDYINFEHLKRELITAAMDARLDSQDFLKCHYVIESIISILVTNSFDGKRGLPQNKDISSFLANIYMRKIDRDLCGIQYFRYMDDIRILTNDKAHANAILLKIICSLREIGLSINSKKTTIYIQKTDEHDSYVNEFDLEAQRLGKMFSSKKRNLVTEAFHGIYDKLKRYILEDKVSDRKFRFYSNRFITYCKAKDVKLPDQFKIEISNILVGTIEKNPECADQLCLVGDALGYAPDLHDDFSKWVCNRKNHTFEWSVYLIIKLLCMQRYHSDELIQMCSDIFRSESQSPTLRAVSSLYLATHGAISDSDLISQLNLTESAFLRRYIKISLIGYNSKDPNIENQYYENENKYLDELYGDDFKFVKPQRSESLNELISEMKDYG